MVWCCVVCCCTVWCCKCVQIGRPITARLLPSQIHHLLESQPASSSWNSNLKRWSRFYGNLPSAELDQSCKKFPLLWKAIWYKVRSLLNMDEWTLADGKKGLLWTKVRSASEVSFFWVFSSAVAAGHIVAYHHYKSSLRSWQTLTNRYPNGWSGNYGSFLKWWAGN